MYFKYIFAMSLSLVLTETQDVGKVTNVEIGIAKDQTVFQRGLCVKQINKDDILSNYKSYYGFANDTRVVTDVLGFLESSNDDSFKEASTFIHKFSMFSPFQFQVTRTGNAKYKVTGISAIKKTQKWLDSLSYITDKYINVMPVITFDGWSESDLFALTMSYKEMIELAIKLQTLCEKYNFDGLILDIWSAFHGRLPTRMLILIIQEIAARLRFQYKFALLVIPPAHANEDVINKEVFKDLTDFVNYIILQTFDYSWSPGPNSPISHVEHFVKYLTPDPLVRRDSIMIGVNFFGNAHTPSGVNKITKTQYLDILENYDGDFVFDEASMEHYFEISTKRGKQVIYYPTLYSLHSRVRLANKLGIRLAISELGQGLEYFYDVL